ncbi:hypothetical protein [Nocardia yamanashiensis]|uniref:hypothetical protein n=1 Tax=Nocardia yamanashiensis TaxID=209247 RepID=UPI000AA2F900|nr:hypothetical protein [Nocardia yamanashiensis]
MDGPEENREKDPDRPKGGRPGPSDQGDDGGMASREVAEDLGTEDGAQEPPD